VREKQATRETLSGEVRQYSLEEQLASGDSLGRIVIHPTSSRFDEIDVAWMFIATTVITG
jgi:hypothetical protein